jgi:DNA helicase-2/ATP-dependent DNA helicase PcrA
MKYTKEFTILDTKDRDSIFKELIKKHGLKDNKDFKESVVAGFIGKQKNAGLSPKDFMKESNNDYEGTMGKLYEEYEKVKEISNALDFDDLLLLPLLLFKKNPEVLQKWQNKFDYILVDEAQDTNGVQFTLMDLLSQ